MNDILTTDENQEQPKLFLWDSLEKTGSAITDSMMILDIDALSHEQRLVISSGDPEGIQELIDEVGDTLANQMKLSATVFVSLINEVFKESGPAEQLRIMELVRSFMNRMKDQ